MSTPTSIVEARAALQRGDVGGAERILNGALAQAPLDPILHTALARTRWGRGDGAHFADPMRAALASAPAALDLRMTCASLLRRAGMLDEARAMLSEGLARTPEQPGLLAALGVVLDAAGESDEGAAMLERACNLAPESAAMQQYYVQTLLRVGKADEARTRLAPLRVHKPLDQGLLALETLALRMLGDPRYGELCDYERLVCTYDIEPPSGYASNTAFNEALAESLRALHPERAHPLDQSLRGGSQTEGSLLRSDDPVIHAFRAALAAPIHHYIAALETPPELVARRTPDYRLSGCWSVRLRPGGYHVNHVHPDGWISSAYYVALPDAIEVNAEQAGWLTFGAPRLPIAGCGVERVIAPRAGMLALFPSYFWHGTNPFSAGAERLTAAFDVVPA